MTRSTAGAEPQHTINDWSRVAVVAQLVGQYRQRARGIISRAVATHDHETTERVGLLLHRLAHVQRHAYSDDPAALQHALAELSAASDDWHLHLLEQEAQR